MAVNIDYNEKEKVTELLLKDDFETLKQKLYQGEIELYDIGEVDNVDAIIKLIENLNILEEYVEYLVSYFDSFILRLPENTPDSIYKTMADALAHHHLIDAEPTECIRNFIFETTKVGKIIPDESLKVLGGPIISGFLISIQELEKTKEWYLVDGAWQLEEFAKYIGKYKNILELYGILVDAVILRNNLKDMHDFALNSKKVYDFMLKHGYDGNEKEELPLECEILTKTRIAKVLLESKNLKWLYMFARDVDNIPKVIMDDIVSFVAHSQSPEFIFLFLCNVDLSIDNITRLVTKLMYIENINYIGYSLVNVGNKYLSGKLQTEKRMEEIRRIKSALKRWLDIRGNHDWLTEPISNPTYQLEEILLKSSDEVLNPFACDMNGTQKTYHE